MHEEFMRQALDAAALALTDNDLPVGAVIVLDNEKVIATGRRSYKTHERLDHGEMAALRIALQAYPKEADWMTIYTTLEPCAMCFGAILNCKIPRVVYAFEDPYGGATCIPVSALPPRHQESYPEILAGVLREDSRELLKQFFETTNRPFWKKNTTNPLQRAVFGLDPAVL